MGKLETARVLVTPRSFGDSDPSLKETLEKSVGEVVYNPFGRALSSAELCDLIPGCDGLIAGVDIIDESVFQHADKLKVVSRYGVGVDKVDLKSAEAHGVIVTNTPFANSQSVAELALGLMLSLLRQIPAAVEKTRMGEWPRIPGKTLSGKTVGLIGFGMIGKRLAQLLSGFDCRILAFDPYPDQDAAIALKVELVSLETLLPQADVVSLHLPLMEATRHMVDKNMIDSMKPGAFFVNTSRGEIVNEADLQETLATGQLAGAGLDVLSAEPPAQDHPLLGLVNVIVTPHSGAHTDGATNAMGWTALEDCLAVLSGKAPKFVVKQREF